jgi:hypothetical protein
MNIFKKIKYFIQNLKFIKVLNTPFKPFGLRFYFGKIERGVPYFLPRKWVKFTYEDALKKATEDCSNERLIYYGKNPLDVVNEFMGYQKAVYLKWFGFTYCGLGYKTKWSDTDYRYEYSPIFSFVFLKRQFCIYIHTEHPDSYWCSWLYYEYHTDKTKSKEERIKDCIENFPQIYTQYICEEKKKVNYYEYNLRKKYLKFIK